MRGASWLSGKARLAFGLLALGLNGCPDPDADLPPVPPRGGPLPILPSPATSGTAQAPTWMDRLPEKGPTGAPPAAVGERVWAATSLAGSEMVDVAIYTVSGIYEGMFALTGRTGQRIDNVHPALVHRAKSIYRLNSNTVVLFYTPSTPAFLGRVSEVVGGESIKIRYDLGGVTRTTEADHVEMPTTGVRPMAYVGFPKAGALSRGLALAATSKEVWVRTASGHVEVHDRGRVQALALPPGRFAVGDVVEAFRWATGYQRGVVVSVVEEGLRYEVERDPRRTGTYFFSSLLPAK